MSSKPSQSQQLNKKIEFVTFVQKQNLTFSEMCKRFQISLSTGYRWLQRFDEEGMEGLKEKSRKPHTCPHQTPHNMQQKVLQLRDKLGWGGRKIRRRLLDLGQSPSAVPAASTITEICRRHEKIDPQQSRKRVALQRFERPSPNDLWQMDFKGHFPLTNGESCHPLTVVDDHSRFVLGLVACRQETGSVVKTALTRIFREYGLPREILADNGGPWGNSNVDHGWTFLSVWLLHLEVVVIHGAYHHPQTQGKDERFNRSLKEECIDRFEWNTFPQTQRRFDWYRGIFNRERPHEALDLDTPLSHYQPSQRRFPERLAELTYPAGMTIRTVDSEGRIRWAGEKHRVGKGFRGYRVGLLEAEQEGELEVYFGSYLIGHVKRQREKGEHAFYSLSVPQKRLLT